MIVPNKLFVLANWKMKPATRGQAVTIAQQLTHGNTAAVEIALMPPALFLKDIQETTTCSFAYGIQDVSPDEIGSCNAQMSPTQAKSVGCDYAIIGHSSLRALGETDASVNQKVRSCIAHDIIPIVCIGESQRDDTGQYISFLQDQIRHSFAGMSKADFEHIIIAYEPLWAIGSDAIREATATEAQEVRILIEKTIDEMTGHIPVGRVTIVYGGSVNTPGQLDQFLDSGMRGVLVGRASIEPDIFNNLVVSAQRRS